MDITVAMYEKMRYNSFWITLFEVSYSNEVTEQLETIVNKMNDAMAETAVVHYLDKAA